MYSNEHIEHVVQVSFLQVYTNVHLLTNRIWELCCTVVLLNVTIGAGLCFILCTCVMLTILAQNFNATIMAVTCPITWKQKSPWLLWRCQDHVLTGAKLYNGVFFLKKKHKCENFYFSGDSDFKWMAQKLVFNNRTALTVVSAAIIGLY